jgi:hypothetical protein
LAEQTTRTTSASRRRMRTFAPLATYLAVKDLPPGTKIQGIDVSFE